MQTSLPDGHRVASPSGRPGPVVVASPHCGRDYPPAFLKQTRLTLFQLRRGEDAFVGELLAGAPAHGCALVRARYGRAYIDLNRDERELDPAMFDGPVPFAPGTERVAAGLGVLPRVVAQGVDIYAGRLPAAEARERIERVHRPYHATLARLLAEARARHGFAVLLDGHSMPPLPNPPLGAPAQVVLGDVKGQSCAPALTDLVERVFRDAGLRVARNDPYAGGHTTRAHGSPAWGVHVLQIEIDRQLYMDPVRLTPNAGFTVLADLLSGLVRTVADAAPRLGLNPVPLAAE